MALGVKQESLFRWSRIAGFASFVEFQSEHRKSHEFGESITIASAFTVAELGKMFPRYILQNGVLSELKIIKSAVWIFRYGEHIITSHSAAEHDTEATARAKFLIYLLENGLISL